MIWTILLGTIVSLFVVSILIIVYEIKKAPLVDDSYSFIDEDYAKNYENSFCSNCKYFDNYDMCLLSKNFGAITYESIGKCKKESYFEPK